MIRIVELFSGIGSQAKAFSRLGEEYEVMNTCEWDFHSILAYERIHRTPELLPEVAHMEKPELLDVLSKYTLSCDGKAPMPYSTLRAISTDGLRAILSAIKKTGNFVSVTDVHSNDLPDKIDLMTYSFPCQDLSCVGAFHGYQQGIDRNSGNRSSLLWEVERILWEMKESKRDMPRFLLLENVSALLSKRHKANFEEWQMILDQLGYTNHVYCLNALDFGLPQNRYRLLMLSVFTGNDPEKEDFVKQYFLGHDLQMELYRSSLNIPKGNLADFLRLDYSNPVYLQEAIECQPRNTPSRKRIWDGNLKIVDETGQIVADHVATLTTKQDRDPNSGNLYMIPQGDLGNYRYLTPRECIMLMGFDEEDYEKIMNNNVLLKKDGWAFTRDRIIRMAGNSIAVNVLVEIFRQMIDIHSVFYPKPGRKTSSDVHSPEVRSFNMSQIKSKHTKPEDIVSKYLYHAGMRRYKRNDSNLPGSPDIAISKYKTAIFVNGCFWHGHEGCKYFKYPKTNEDFWRNKINTNRERDQRKAEELKALGWNVIVVWECELKGENAEKRLADLVAEIKSHAN